MVIIELNEDMILNFEDGIIYKGKGIPPRTRQGYGVLLDAQNKDIYKG